MQPKISVVIPFYNVEKYFAECLDSVLSQSYRNIEVICVDDHGQDGSRAIADQYAARDSRVKVLDPGRNLGAGRARDAAVDIMEGEYFMFLDSDDILPEYAVQKMYSALKRTGADMVTGQFKAFADEDLPELHHSVDSLNATFELTRTFDEQITPKNFQRMLDVTYGVACGKLFSTEFMRRKEIRFYSGNILHEDKGYFLKCVASLPHLASIEDLVLLYRIRPSSTMTTETRAQKERRKRDIIIAVNDAVNHIYAMHDKPLADELVQLVQSHRSFAPHFDKKRLGGLARFRWYRHEKLVELFHVELYREKVRRDGVKLYRLLGITFRKDKIFE